MTVWEIIKQLAECEPSAIVHFRANIDAETIKELAEGGERLINEPFYLQEINNDDTDVDFVLEY